MPGFARLQSRLNPVPESLNSPDIAPGTCTATTLQVSKQFSWQELFILTHSFKCQAED